MEKKLVAVLYKKLEPGSALNAVAHMAIGLGGLLCKKGEIDELKLDSYFDSSGGEHKSISDFPFIILKAGLGQIKNLAQFANNQNIACTHFLKTMTIGTYAEQKSETAKVSEEELEYLGVCMFGDIEEINDLTKKFSLWN